MEIIKKVKFLLTQNIIFRYLIGGLMIIIIFFAFLIYLYQFNQNKILQNKKDDLEKKLTLAITDLNHLKSQDQVKINQTLNQEVLNINKTYKETVFAYEEILKLEDKKITTEILKEDFTQILTFLSTQNYASASALLTQLNQKINLEKQKLIAIQVTPLPNIPISNAPPANGYSRQNVQTDNGTFLVDIISADLNSTKVIIDTASDSDCQNDCPVLSLADYVSRSGGFAGVNGSYFCPSTYPSCADKKNSFDTLLMNKNKYYFNSDNNKYSTVPLVAFNGNQAIFKERSLDWGRDTNVDAVIANRPLLVFNGQIAFTGEGEPKEGSRGNRSFIGNKGSLVYIGVVHSSSVADSARVLKTLGLDNALNLDNGGSTALWFGNYKMGPGRNIPNAVVLVKK